MIVDKFTLKARASLIGFQHQLVLSRDLLLIGFDQSVRGIRELRPFAGGARTFFPSFLNHGFGFVDLVPLELAGPMGFLQHTTKSLVIMLCTGDVEGGGQRNGPVLDRFDQPFLALPQQKYDVAHVAVGKARAMNDVLDGVVSGQEEFDVGKDLEWAIAAPRDILRQRHDECIFVGDVDDESRNVGFAEKTKRVEPLGRSNPGRT